MASSKLCTLEISRNDSVTKDDTRSGTSIRASRLVEGRAETATGGRILQMRRRRQERMTIETEIVAHGSPEIRMLACATRCRHRGDPQGVDRTRATTTSSRTPRENAVTAIVNGDLSSVYLSPFA